MANDAEVQLAVDQAMKDQKKQKRKKKLIIFGVILAVIVVSSWSPIGQRTTTLTNRQHE